MQIMGFHLPLFAIFTFSVFSIVHFNAGRNINDVVVNNTLTIGYLWPWTHAWPVGPYSASALVVALTEIERRQLLPGFNIEWIMEDSWCEGKRGMQMAVEIWDRVSDLDVVIGPGCSVACEPVALLCASWNIPVISPRMWQWTFVR